MKKAWTKTAFSEDITWNYARVGEKLGRKSILRVLILVGIEVCQEYYFQKYPPTLPGGSLAALVEAARIPPPNPHILPK